MEDLREKELIAEVRHRESGRDRRAIVAIAVGVVLLVASWMTTYTLLGHVVTGNTILGRSSNCEEVVMTVESASYWWGAAVGFATSLGWILAIHFIVSGISELRDGGLQRAMLAAYDRMNEAAKNKASA
jgi:hypothetical protein